MTKVIDKRRGVLMNVHPTESEVHLYNFAHEFHLQLPCLAIKTIQMPSLGSKEALYVR